MTAEEIMAELQPLGSESYVRILRNHCIEGPCLGVKIEELKRIQKRTGQDYQLALDLYDTGVYDAMYLAGLIADDMRMTKRDLKRWLTRAGSGPVVEYVVAPTAAGGRFGLELAREWIESPKELVATGGWATLSGVVSIKPDADLDLPELKRLLKRIETSIHDQQNLVRGVMNQFVIAAGSFVAGLTDTAIAAATKIGPVTVDMGNNACKVPFAPDYIRKVQARGTIGKKRKSAKC